MTKPTRKREKAKLPTGRCPMHGHYKGDRRPVNGCEECQKVWERVCREEEAYFEAMKRRTLHDDRATVPDGS